MDIYTSWMVNTPIAHRGLHDSASPENSMSAFAKAMNCGYAIEMDIHMSADGEIVVFHDDNLKRITGCDRAICEMTLAELKQLKLSGTEETIPTFVEFLDLVGGKVPLLIEIKDHKNIGVLEQKTADILNNYKGEFAVQSFNPFIVKWFKINAPTFVRGQLASDFEGNKTLSRLKRYLLKNLFFIKSNGSQFVSYDVKAIKRAQIKRLRRKIPVIMWTVRKQEQLTECKEYYDNFIFEKFIPQ